MKYTVLETEMGWMGVLATYKGLRRMTIPLPTPEEALDELGPYLDGAELDPDYFGDMANRIQAYLQGQDVPFPEEMDVPWATPFQEAVWKATRAIPRGETRSYGDIAAQVGRPQGARAVGQAMSTNPLAILTPCHRVIASDGGLGGYGNHLDVKKHLLKMEGVQSPMWDS